MAIYYRGAGVGAYWHLHDARLTGFHPHLPGMNRSVARIIMHIAKTTTSSPYVSLTLSYEVAWVYAMMGLHRPTKANPAFVYQIEIDDPPPPGLLLVDPVRDVAAACPVPLKPNTYQHDGGPSVLLGLVNSRYRHFLHRPIKQPAPSAAHALPRISDELRTLVNSLRDAELLAVGTIPIACVVNRHNVY